VSGGIPDDLNYAPLYYDKLGNPISMERWGILHSDFDYVVVAKDPILVGGVTLEVSTVWIGINHRFGGGPPLIFETMVFGPEREVYCQRYSTEEQAREGHAVAMRKLIAEQERQQR